jgi:hypothetical protein
MTWSEIAVLVIVTAAFLGWWLWVMANRLDRLHKKVAASRAALDNQLVRRASCAAELAACGALDPVSSVLVADAAWTALASGGYGREDLVLTVPELAPVVDAVVAVASDRTSEETVHAPSEPGESTSTTDGGEWLDGPEEDLCAVLPGADDRQQAESDLSRTLRAAFADPDEVLAGPEDAFADELVAALVAAWYRVQLARRFHNEAVAQTQRVRRKALVRALRLHGRAAMPHTVEIDDGWPDGLPRPGQVG